MYCNLRAISRVPPRLTESYITRPHGKIKGVFWERVVAECVAVRAKECLALSCIQFDRRFGSHPNGLNRALKTDLSIALFPLSSAIVYPCVDDIRLEAKSMVKSAGL